LILDILVVSLQSVAGKCEARLWRSGAKIHREGAKDAKLIVYFVFFLALLAFKIVLNKATTLKRETADIFKILKI